jgi:hypothetical protein
MDVLLKVQGKIQTIIIPFLLATITFMSLYLTSDNPQKTDDHLWYGFNLSFWLIFSFSLVLVIIFLHEFAAGKKRNHRIS